MSTLDNMTGVTAERAADILRAATQGTGSWVTFNERGVLIAAGLLAEKTSGLEITAFGWLALTDWRARAQERAKHSNATANERGENGVDPPS